MRAIILAGLLIFIATPVLLGCDTETRQAKQASSKEIYELSEKCAKSAAEKFKQVNGKEGLVKSPDGAGSVNQNYSCHYNVKLNKCFMLCTYTTPETIGKESWASWHSKELVV